MMKEVLNSSLFLPGETYYITYLLSPEAASRLPVCFHLTETVSGSAWRPSLSPPPTATRAAGLSLPFTPVVSYFPPDYRN